MNLVRGVRCARFLTRRAGLRNVACGERQIHAPVVLYRHVCPMGMSSAMETQSRILSALSTSIDQTRLMATKKIKQPPTKHLSFDWGGDLTLAPVVPVPLSEPTLDFEDLPELETSDSIIKKLVSLEFADGRAKLDKELDIVLKQIQDHPGDHNSLEVRIAKATVHIRLQIRHCLEFRKDKKSKVRLLEAIQLRTKNLKKLQQYDIERFHWIQEELGIQYNPVPKYNRKVSKRAMRRQIAREACWATIEEKVNAFKAKLEVERQEFDDFKKSELDEINITLEQMGLEMKPTLRETIEQMGIGQDIFKKEPFKTRRTALLEKKFELYGLRNRDRGSDPRIKFLK